MCMGCSALDGMAAAKRPGLPARATPLLAGLGPRRRRAGLDEAASQAGADADGTRPFDGLDGPGSARAAQEAPA